MTVKGNLVDRALEVLSIHNDAPLDCIHFGSTYYGCDRTECALLYNNSPESVNFVAVLDEDAVAQEMVCWKIFKVISNIIEKSNLYFCCPKVETDELIFSSTPALIVRGDDRHHH